MILILTMAGRYTRFVNEGYKFPKYLLPWADKSILSAILAEMVKSSPFSKILLIANKRDEIYMPHVRAIMKTYSIDPINLYLIPDTCGQAETALIGLDILEKNKRIDVPIIFHNVDTILYGRNFRELTKILKTSDGYIDVFQSSHHDYSYVLADKNEKVIEIAEKAVISNLATSGLYGFSCPKKFRQYYFKTDRYISSIYKKIIADNGKVSIGEKHTSNETIVLGTPEEYLNASILVESVLTH